MSGWDNIELESDNPVFWICYHACMLYMHGVLTYEDFMKIYHEQTANEI
jgi:hypothetical protein